MDMTTCDRYREALLEAEPDDLRGLGPTEVARHIRACPACARAGEIILETTASLNVFLDVGGEMAAPDLDAVLRRAAASVRTTPPNDRPESMVPWRVNRRWVGLAAAAAITALLLLPGQPPPLPPVATVAAAAPLPTVESAPGQTVAVFETQNPDITVLWFF
jgi:anti-sigma factor RsiW